MTPRLLYLAHTSDAIREQALYSILSAFAHAGASPPAVHVYTDRPAAFARLDGRVRIRTVSPGELAAWAGPQQFKLRTKPAALRDLAAACPGDPLLLLDADTVFTGPPQALFGRIGSGAAVLHEREYDIASSDLAVMCRFRRRIARASFRGERLDLRCAMWNSGAVGLHPTHAPLIDEWLALIDEVYPRCRRWLTEQFAISRLLQRPGLTLSEASDVVVHYWFDKDAYGAAIRDALARTGPLGLDEAIAHVRATPIARPRRAAAYGRRANLFQRILGW